MSAPSAVPAVVLVRPREEGNVGAACRAMANMGLAELRLVEPAATLAGVARAFAVGAHDVLEGARRFATFEEAIAPFGRVVGTTSARDRRLSVPVVTPGELPALLAGDPPGTPTALVFGSEVGGLTNDELAACDPVVTVPCAPAQPTLNLAQAVLVVAYELYVGGGPGAAGPLAETVVAPPAPAAAVAGLFAHLRGRARRGRLRARPDLPRRDARPASPRLPGAAQRAGGDAAAGRSEADRERPGARRPTPGRRGLRARRRPGGR